MASITSPKPHEIQPTIPQPPRTTRAALLGGAVLGAPLLLAALKLMPPLDLRFQAPFGHFTIVTGAAGIAVGLALLMLRVGVVRRDGRVLIISAAFLALSSIFLVHAIATPGVVFTNTSVATAWSTPIALAVCAIVLASSTVERLAQQAWIVRRWRWWVAAGVGCWLLYAGFMLWYVPAQTAPNPSQSVAHNHGEPDSYAGDAEAQPASPSGLPALMTAISPYVLPPLFLAIVCLYSGTAWIYAQQYRRTPTRPLRALTFGALLLAQTALAAHMGTLWHISFWLYHVFLLAAMLTITYGVLSGYEQTGSFSSMVEGLFLGTTVQRQRAAFQDGMAALLSALENGDVQHLPTLRDELRRRFALAEDQLDLLEQTVQVVAQGRDEQHRLGALAAVSSAATSHLDPDALLRDAVTSFAETTNAALCAIGLINGTTITFDANHCRAINEPIEQSFAVDRASLPATLFSQEHGLLIGPMSAAFGPLNVQQRPVLVLPLRHHDQVLGLMLVLPQANTPIDERIITVWRSITAHLATALANAQLYQELRAKHRRLQQSEQAREQLTQMVIHDLKNPLTSIKGFHTLLHMTNLTAEQQEFVQGAQRSTATMMQLINDMLDLARLEEGRLILQREPTNIVKLLEDCRAELDAWSTQSHKSIEIGSGPTFAVLHIDPSLMRRVIINLLSNALKHTPPNTAITLNAGIDAEAARIVVHDTGPGIPPERLATIFERFSATQEQDQQSNTGLGLSFCKLAVETHGGTLSVQSAPQTGTTFTIVLPRHAPAP